MKASLIDAFFMPGGEGSHPHDGATIAQFIGIANSKPDRRFYV